jgi:dehydrodolichyl diphosphate syntase complex subunit NUS1
MVLSSETEVYRRDAQRGNLLSPQEREDLLEPYLPQPPKPSSHRKTRPVRTFLKTQLHILVFTIIQTLFSIYVRFRQAYHAILSRALAILYYHHRTPELIRKDIKGLSRLPRHLSVVLELQQEERGGAGLEILLDEAAEISAWCACVGIPLLSIYERTGILKNYIPTTHRTVAAKLHDYFGRRRPSLQVRAPHMPSFLNGDIAEQSASTNGSGDLANLTSP